MGSGFHSYILSIWITGCFKLLPQNITPAFTGAAGALTLVLHIKTSVTSTF